jgi:uncharacterized protein
MLKLIYFTTLRAADMVSAASCGYLLYSAYYGREQIAKLLMDHRADVNLTNQQGYSALAYAEQYGWDGIKRLLKARGAKSDY